MITIKGAKVEKSTTGGPDVIAFELDRPSVTFSVGGPDRWFVRFLADGTMEVNPEFTLDEAARGFWQSAEVARRHVIIAGLSLAFEDIAQRCSNLCREEGAELSERDEGAFHELIALRGDLERRIADIARGGPMPGSG